MIIWLPLTQCPLLFWDGIFHLDWNISCSIVTKKKNSCTLKWGSATALLPQQDTVECNLYPKAKGVFPEGCCGKAWAHNRLGGHVFLCHALWGHLILPQSRIWPCRYHFKTWTLIKTQSCQRPEIYGVEFYCG